ncbi:MAG: antibiotic biosynthesis monooxygenase [Methanobacterium sp.]|jgi:heme-degrading monooxygenase HmoA
MTYVLVIHEVEEYKNWKPVYDEDGVTQKDKGSKGVFVFRNANDPHQLVVITEWEDMEEAKNFAESEDLITTM